MHPHFIAGEIQEFKQELNSLDKSKRKDAVKKVIAGTVVASFSRIES